MFRRRIFYEKSKVERREFRKWFLPWNRLIFMGLWIDLAWPSFKCYIAKINRALSSFVKGRVEYELHSANRGVFLIAQSVTSKNRCSILCWGEFSSVVKGCLWLWKSWYLCLNFLGIVLSFFSLRGVIFAVFDFLD